MARILIIEDDELVRSMLKTMLEREGYEVLEAPDGKEGIKVSNNSPADLVITDIIMPEKEGIETIIELKQISPKMKIIAISGGGRIGAETYLNIAKKFGAAFTFTKPIDRKELLNAIQEVLKQP
ncbi:response regulator [Desulfonema magnum]|uniref:Two component system response regulator n=1 Tax=Desulfonema magnum TaxID=45655 RepID=A0A975BNP3_9BACT|nr:response regulator [Desulfonema magnum]QTA88344.1 Two component system response regulator [Desulfonema magnum]